MQPDDELCLCFHVTQRKVANYLRIEKPRRVAQLSECYGAGTGCGWCRPFLERMFAAAQSENREAGSSVVGKSVMGEAAVGEVRNEAGDDNGLFAELPNAADYARERGKYVRAGGGTPPAGATLPAPEERS